MLKLMNLSTYNYDVERFDCSKHNLVNFLRKNKMDGIELLHPIGFKENIIPAEVVKGVHLKYYPTWLDFWNNNTQELLKQFKSLGIIEKYYGGIDRQIMIEHYKKEIRKANEINAEYVVFHVAHVQEKHTYDYDFTYTDEEVIDAAADLINEVFDGIETNVKLLFENVWWPGFTMLSYNNACRLLNEVKYSNKGFMLDTAHLMNTNLQLKSEKQGIEYIINTIKNLGELKDLIKGIHLNCSLSGEYVMKKINSTRGKEFNLNPMDEEVFMHVFNIDNHKPFKDTSVKKLIDFIKPEYIVYEFVANSIKELEEYIQTQDVACLG